MKKLFALLLILILTMSMVSAQEDDLDELARYAVGEGGEITLISGDEDESHEDLWILLIVLLPTDYVETYIYEYAVFDSEDTLAYVSELEEDEWEFAISINEDPERALTVVHEFGHIVALNNTQYDTYPTIIDDRADPLSDDEYSDGLDDDIAACSTIAFEDGCAIDESYLALFTEEFWVNFDVEDIFDIDPEDSFGYFFYDNPDAFVSEYAATNPIEDFAESFSYFIGLDEEDYPVDGELYEMDAKILWFEQFPELMEMRETIRGNAEANGVTFEFGDESNYFYGE